MSVHLLVSVETSVGLDALSVINFLMASSTFVALSATGTCDDKATTPSTSSKCATLSSSPQID